MSSANHKLPTATHMTRNHVQVGVKTESGKTEIGKGDGEQEGEEEKEEEDEGEMKRRKRRRGGRGRGAIYSPERVNGWINAFANLSQEE